MVEISFNQTNFFNKFFSKSVMLYEKKSIENFSYKKEISIIDSLPIVNS